MTYRKLINDRWRFAKIFVEGAEEDPAVPEESRFERVDLPHDMCISKTDDFYRSAVGFYRTEITRSELRGDTRHALLCFDGVYCDSTLYVNGVKAGGRRYGYSAFSFDIYPLLDREVNSILLTVRYICPNSRWYSGAGIFRDVYLTEQGESYLKTDGVYLHSEKTEDGWRMTLSAEAHGGDTVCFSALGKEAEAPVMDGKAGAELLFGNDAPVWDTEHPELFTVSVRLFENGRTADEQTVRTGLREARFTADRGFVLNGRVLKLNGVCLHHDLGALGAAFNRQASRRQLELMKEMGVNAIRTSHNMPAAAMMDLCDELGLLVDSEAFDMWEIPKTDHDYARFFRENMPLDVESWIRRDRNRPSVILWSMGNEIPDTHASEHGREVMLRIREEVYRHDPLRNAEATIGSNYMWWENTQKCADELKLTGYNYAEVLYTPHHEKHPDWMIYGSETASIVMSRGIYHFPAKENILAEDDLQCSSLNNSFTSWGAKSVDWCITADRDTPFSAGQFLWSGTDYLGEPTPYHTKNSYFGMADTAGFKKDIFYIFKAAWNKKAPPFVHLWPYWDFNEGETVDVLSVTNGRETALFLNGREIGRQRTDLEHGDTVCAHWTLPYEKGTLEAVAYDENGREIARDTKRSFTNAIRLHAEADKTKMRADGQDMIFITVTALDRDGLTVENAVDRVHVKVEGAARLAGTDAGDSTDMESFRQNHRRMFSGKLLIMLSALDRAGEITVTLTSPSLEGTVLKLESTECPEEERRGRGVYERISETECPADIPVRKVELSFPDGTQLTKEKPRLRVQARILPENATCRDLAWRVTNDAGVDSPLACVEADGTSAYVTGRFDGEFTLRCTASSGAPHARVISRMPLCCTGFGEAMLDPYSFISFSLNTYTEGSVSAGNERGIATGKDSETVIGFDGVDFGPDGSDEVCVPIFCLNSEAYPVEIWDGIPGKGGERVCAAVYQKKSIWNVYQEDTFRLEKRLKGIHTLCFVTHDKMHLKGFIFTKRSRAYSPLYAGDAENVYGDSFEKSGNALLAIGNNTVIDYGTLDFENAASLRVLVTGRSPIPLNTLHFRFTEQDGTSFTVPAEFCFTEGPEEKEFSLSVPEKCFGRLKTELVFLPGSRFDLYGIRFIRDV